MKCRILFLLTVTALVSGCHWQCSGAAFARTGENDLISAGEEFEEPSAAPDTVFTSEPIPPEVEARIRGISYPDNATIPLGDLRYLRLSYVDFDDVPQVGELICNKQIADDLLDIFRKLYEARYPIKSIRLIDEFGGSDDASMEADNTSCFNYRPVSGGRSLSKHALGLAIDVNPLENPYVKGDKVLPPAGAPFVDRERPFAHKIDRSDLCYRLFIAHGFIWGGNWRTLKDYQHFEK